PKAKPRVDGGSRRFLSNFPHRPSSLRLSGHFPHVGGRTARLTLALCALMAAEAAVFALDALFPPNLARAERSSPVALDRRGAWLRALPVENGRWRIRADLSRTDPTFLSRVIEVEDARFWLHPGVDPLAVARAAGSAALSGRISSGASTLTMQTARLLEPRPRNL